MNTETDRSKPALWSQNTPKVILLTVLIAGMLILALLGIRRLMPNRTDLRAGISGSVISLRESLTYKDSSSFSTTWRWTFGDGSQAFTSSGMHQYGAPGNYIVHLLVNNRIADSFFVTVTDTARTVPLQDSIARIDAPLTGMQFENLVFRALGTGASQYRWKFGETGTIDSKEPFVQYYYKEPGDYTVLLYTDNSEYPVRHQIKILPSYERKTDTLDIEGIYKKQEDDFKMHLQQIANGNSFNTHYYYLLRKYLCNNEKLPIKINGQKVNDFNSYCLGLQFDEGVTIQSVKLTPDEELKCIKAVEVKQAKVP